MRARSMFACSSKRAFSSTSATTCLPASAAFTSDATMPASSPPVRYSVCLIASTFAVARRPGRRTLHRVARTSRTGGARACRRCRIAQNTSLSSPPASCGGFCGVNGGYFSSGRRSAYRSHSPPRSSGASTWYTSFGPSSSSRHSSSSTSGVMLRVDLEPHRERRTSCAAGARSPSRRAGLRIRR